MKRMLLALLAVVGLLLVTDSASAHYRYYRPYRSFGVFVGPGYYGGGYYPYRTRYVRRMYYPPPSYGGYVYPYRGCRCGPPPAPYYYY